MPTIVLLSRFMATASDGATHTLFNFSANVIWNNLVLIYPATIVLIAGYMIDRERTDHTLKNILTIPISFRKMLIGKLVVISRIFSGWYGTDAFSDGWYQSDFLHTSGLTLIGYQDGSSDPTGNILLSVASILFILAVTFIIVFTAKNREVTTAKKKKKNSGKTVQKRNHSAR